MKKQFIQTICILFLSLFLTISAFAQEEAGGDVDDLSSAPTAPIENWVPILLMAGIGTAFYFTKKKKTA
ncbi:hypothetical protein [Flavobacterium tegetincola]|uniref:hypothetical protein n=1 Tax=Flavobacterium tegetincola TaxID=150172 RepID=UPI00042A22BF|nr:hypothetical protein [Flavobacterium tegetincola]